MINLSDPNRISDEIKELEFLIRKCSFAVPETIRNYLISRQNELKTWEREKEQLQTTTCKPGANCPRPHHLLLLGEKCPTCKQSVEARAEALAIAKESAE